MSGLRKRSGLGGMLGLVGAGLLMVLCCVGPLLLGAGVLGAVGGALRNPWLITVGAVAALTAVAFALRCRSRRRHGSRPEDCCPSVPGPSSTHDHDAHKQSGDNAPQHRDIP